MAKKLHNGIQTLGLPMYVVLTVINGVCFGGIVQSDKGWLDALLLAIFVLSAIATVVSADGFVPKEPEGRFALSFIHVLTLQLGVCSACCGDGSIMLTARVMLVISVVTGYAALFYHKIFKEETPDA